MVVTFLTFHEKKHVNKIYVFQPVSEHEQHGIDHVALATSVGAHDGGEAFVERTQHLK